MNTADAPLKFPALLDAVEKRSALQQKCFYWTIGGQVAALALAAAASLIPSRVLHGIGPLVSLILFLGVILIQVIRASDRAEREWYEARAACESIKAISWEFSVGGEAFRLSDETAEDRYLDLIRSILSQLKHLDVSVASSEDAGVTSRMSALRRSSIETRRRIYRRDRIDDQLGWYSRRSETNKKNAKLWRGILITTSLTAIVAGVLRARGDLDLDLLSVMAAVASGVIVWTQANRYTQLAEAYSVTSQDIALLATTLEGGSVEEEWAQFVHDAEAAFSREHAMWVSRKQGPL